MYVSWNATYPVDTSAEAGAYIRRMFKGDRTHNVVSRSGERWVESDEPYELPPYQLAFEMVWRRDGRELPIGRFVLPGIGDRDRLSFETRLGDFPAGPFELVIRPCPELVRHAPSLERVWGGEEVVLPRRLRR